MKSSVALDAAVMAVAFGLSLLGLIAAWRAWDRRRHVGAFLGGTLLAWALSTWLWGSLFGAEIGIPLAIETGALAAFGFILSRAEWRSARAPRERRVEALPAPVRHRRLRGFARVLIAGPLALVAALGIGVLIAIGAPLQEQTRLILAGLIMPTLWAIAIVWTLTERRLVVSAASLAVIGVVGFGLALLPGA